MAPWWRTQSCGAVKFADGPDDLGYIACAEYSTLVLVCLLKEPEVGHDQ